MSDMTYIGELIADDVAGFACSKSKLVSDGLLHLRPFNVSPTGQLDLSERYQVPLDEAPKDKRRLEAGDILFNNTNSVEWVGKSALIREPMEAGFSNHMTRVRVDRSRLLPEWFAYWLSRKQAAGFFAANATQWVSQAAYRIADLKKIEVHLPPIAEQQRIVDILDRASGIQRLRKAADDKVRELVPALFVEMFGDPAENSKGWDQAELGQVGQLDRGKSRHRPRDAKELFGGPFPFIQTGDVANSGGYVDTYSATYSELGLSQSRLWAKGTLCITIAANIAKTGILSFDACFPDSVVGFIPGERVATEFVRAWLGFLQPVLERDAPQAAQKNINLDILRNLKIPCPPMDLQQRFVAACNSIRAVSLMAAEAAKMSDQISASAASRYFD